MKTIKLLSLTFLFLCHQNFLPQKKALIFGISGQDGIYLTQLLIEKGYEVHGVVRESGSQKTRQLKRFFDDEKHDTQPILHFGDVTDLINILELINSIAPDEIYNLAAQSNVKISFDTAFSTAQINALGALNILEAIKSLKHNIRYFQASSSEMFGKSNEFLQNEMTSFAPRSPYAIAKLYAHWITINYREAYGVFACNGILFNHESPLRPESFVSKKIAKAAVQIAAGVQDILYLGNLDVKRDWGYAKDYVQAMWLTLQEELPDDYVIATGKNHSVREFVELAFKIVGIEIEWNGVGIEEKGINKKTGKTVIAIDSAYFRPTEVQSSCGDASYIKKKLGWQPTTSFNNLITLMVEHEIRDLETTNQERKI